MRPRRRSALPSWAASIKRNKNTVILSHALFAKQSVQPIVRQSTENLISLLNQESPRGCSTAKASLCFHVTAQVDSRPSRAPITFGAVTKAVCTVPCAALGQETPLPHRGLCGPLSPTAAGFWRAVTKVVRHSGPHSPLCGSGSGDAPSAQGTVRTPFADSRVRPHSLGSVGKVRINARSPPPNSRPGTSPTPTGSRRRSIIDRSDVGRMVFSGTNQPLPPQIQFPGSPAPQSGFGRDRKKPSPPFTPTLNHSSFLGRIPKKLAVLKRLEGPRQHATVRASIPCSTILSSLPPLRRPLPPRTALLATSTTKPRSRLRPTRCWASRTLLG